jgi:sugar phosphate isomerase/epimerase
MFRAKISVPTLALGSNLKRSLHAAMELGADGVQFDLYHELSVREFGPTARRQLLHALHERDMQPASAHVPLRSPLIDAEKLDARIAAIAEAIEFASHLKIRVLTLRIGRIPAEESPEYEKLLLPAVTDLAAAGNRHGVVPCLIPCGDSAESLRSLIGRVRTGPLAVEADLGGWILSRQSPVSELRELHDFIQHVQIRDAVRDLDGLGKEVPVGRGEIDWDEIAALLNEMDYAGWMNVTRTGGNDPTGDIGRAIQYMRNLLPG